MLHWIKRTLTIRWSTLAREAAKGKNHQYALDDGLPELREAIAAWYGRRFGVTLDPSREIYPLLGSKEGIAHFPLAVINPGDAVLIPDPQSRVNSEVIEPYCDPVQRFSGSDYDFGADIQVYLCRFD